MKKLDAIAFGIAWALVWGLGVFILYAGARFFDYGLPFVKVMNSVYIGARATIKGTVIATIWAVVDGFIGGYLLATIYNLSTAEK